MIPQSHGTKEEPWQAQTAAVAPPLGVLVAKSFRLYK